jgi:tRNA (mo5U34)-methyltransferase
LIKNEELKEEIKKMKDEELKEEIKKINWFHKINLGNGIITPGIDYSPTKLNQIQMDQDLTGKTVLDIGAWDGFFSFEAERRGAKKVLAIDGYIWKGAKDGFDLAKKALGSKVEEKIMDVMDISPKSIGIFDCVLFLGVFYHLCHPLLALEKIASVTKNQLILETHGELIGGKRPMMVFYPGKEMNKDVTNWWGPNPSAIMSMLNHVGFKKTKCVYTTPFITRFKNAILNRGTPEISLRNKIGITRMVFHAWK